MAGAETADSPVSHDESTTLDNPEYYLNRWLSHLQFNIRVLAQALDERHPLLERLKFLLIFSSNMDEFFEIRVAGLQQQIQFSRETSGLDGLHPQQVLRQISELSHEYVAKQYEILNEVLLPLMEQEGIRFLRRADWTDAQAHWIENFFRTDIQPVISPIGLDPAHPFPRLVNKSLNFIVSLEGKDAFGRDTGLAIVPAPRSLPRIIRLPDEISDGTNNFVFLSSMIHAHAEDLFPGMTVKGCYQFRTTRNADLQLDPEEVEDIARALRGELLSRRFGSAVRLEVADNTPKELTDFLLKEFGLTEDELYRVNGPVNLMRLMSLPKLINRPDLQDPPFSPGVPKLLNRKDSLFDSIAQKDILLLHPFESFTPVIELLRQAAKDPEVLAIKMTLYRSGTQSEIVDALLEAARYGKEVTAVVELRARFDEEENLELAARLQEAGATVVYGVVGYKTHAKMILVVRREQGHMRRYVHMGTGNYHASNARLYTDYSFFTADPQIGEDVHHVFQQLTGMGKTQKMTKVLNAPFALKRGLLKLIDGEIKAAQEGRPARIICKTNGLTEPKVMQALLRASQAGVQIELIVRGMCCIRPGIPGVSDNIRVRSIIGRFLEHTRVYYFENGEPGLYCGSADLMERNLNSRVETCFPVEDQALRRRILDELQLYLDDNSQSWDLQTDGSYVQNHPGDAEPVSAQARLLTKLTG